MNMSAINAMGNAPIQPFRKALESLKSCEARQQLPFAKFHQHSKCGADT